MMRLELERKANQFESAVLVYSSSKGFACTVLQLKVIGINLRSFVVFQLSPDFAGLNCGLT